MWQDAVDSRNTDVHREFDNQDGHIPVIHSVHARRTQDSMVLEDGWYEEEMDRRERFRSPDTYMPGVRALHLNVLHVKIIK